MLLPTRRLAHVATQTTRNLGRFVSTETKVKLKPLRDTLRAVQTLAADPSVLPEVVTSFLALPDGENGGFHKPLLSSLGQNPSVSTRFDDAARIMDRYLHVSRIAIPPSHAEAVEHFVLHPPSAKGLRKKLRRVMYLRYTDSPFIALDHVLRIAGNTVPAELALRYWLLVVPRHLARLKTPWDLLLFDLDATRQEFVRQLRVLEEQKPKLVQRHDLHDALMWAYAATRVAPDDVARHRGAILAKGAKLSFRAVEYALASTRSLDELERVWAQLKELLPDGKGQHYRIPTCELFYAQHLVRLGARDAALAVAKRYPADGELQWLFETDDDAATGAAVTDAAKNLEEHRQTLFVARRNRALAAQLARNGLDQEDVLFVLSIHSPFADTIRHKHRFHRNFSRAGGIGTKSL